MSAMPNSDSVSGYSAKKRLPSTTAQAIWLYCAGATRLAGAARIAASIVELADAAEAADGGEVGERRQAREPEDRDRQDGAHGQRPGHHDADQADPPFGVADHAHDDHAYRADDRHAGGGKVTDVELAEARLDDEQHPGEADADGREPPPPDRLAEEEEGKQGYEDRGQEDERVHLGKRDRGEGKGPEEP